MEFKGTKGKWRINERASRNVRCDNGISIVNCSSGQSGDLEEQEKANALLISKAPEMLEMLKHLAKNTPNKNEYEKIEQLIKEATEL